MRFLVIGLGSMGKRRIRNLQAMGFADIVGVDPRQDRRSEAVAKYGITVFTDCGEAIKRHTPDALIVSTSPECHMQYAREALRKRFHCFIEASVVDAAGVLALHEEAQCSDVVIAPSCTMRFFPGPKKVREIVRSGIIGKPINLNYQTGQYLPDWHPWESIKDFYVSVRETGGCREIVPFELTWLVDLFGLPEPIACIKRKLTDIDIDIDDIYHCWLQFPRDLMANLTVEVISQPHASREFRLLGSTGELVFSADENCVRYSTKEHPEWQRIDLGSGTVESGYINPEEPYIAEMGAFVAAACARNSKLFPNTLSDDYLLLRLLDRLDEISQEKR